MRHAVHPHRPGRDLPAGWLEVGDEHPVTGRGEETAEGKEGERRRRHPGDQEHGLGVAAPRQHRDAPRSRRAPWERPRHRRGGRRRRRGSGRRGTRRMRRCGRSRRRVWGRWRSVRRRGRRRAPRRGWRQRAGGATRACADRSTLPPSLRGSSSTTTIVGGDGGQRQHLRQLGPEPGGVEGHPGRAVGLDQASQAAPVEDGDRIDDPGQRPHRRPHLSEVHSHAVHLHQVVDPTAVLEQPVVAPPSEITRPHQAPAVGGDAEHLRAAGVIAGVAARQRRGEHLDPTHARGGVDVGESDLAPGTGRPTGSGPGRMAVSGPTRWVAIPKVSVHA